MISFQRVSPHIYALTFEKFLYIGETQREPPFRWAEHFSPSGSFICALEKVGVTEEDFRIREFFAESFACPEILSLKPLLRKSATQEVEDLVHRKVLTSQVLYPYRVISNTVRTAPRDSVWNCSEKVADSILEKLEDSLSRAG